MLDLSTNTTALYEIKDIEGNILTLKIPTQKMFRKMMVMQSLPEEKQLEGIYEIFRDILNLNTNGFVYDLDYVEVFDIQVASLVIKDYFEWVGKQLGE